MENEKVDEKRAREWFRSKEVTQLRWELTDRYKYSAEDAECKLLAAFAESECSRLASRVEELEKALRWSTESLRGCLRLVRGNGYRADVNKINHGLEMCECLLAQQGLRVAQL